SIFSCQWSSDPRDLRSFPTRRSSDLGSRYVAGDAEPLACPRSFRQVRARRRDRRLPVVRSDGVFVRPAVPRTAAALRRRYRRGRSEEHTSELQSRENLVCRLLLEKKK